MVYDVLPDSSRASSTGSRTTAARILRAGRRRFRRDVGRHVARGPPLATVIGFRDDAALKRFLDDPAAADLGAKFDSFIGPHAHRVYRRLPVYRVDALSAPPAG
jgi:hypothetical protein